MCESLTFLGWGDYEAIQAVSSKFYNGNPVTGFYNKFFEQRFVDAIWSKRKTGLTMEKGRTSYFQSPNIKNKPTLLLDYPVSENIKDIKLKTQRNWINRSPIYLGRSSEICYEGSLKLAENIEQELRLMLSTKMNPENYGSTINYISIYPQFSGTSQITNEYYTL